MRFLEKLRENLLYKLIALGLALLLWYIVHDPFGQIPLRTEDPVSQVTSAQENSL